MNNKKGFTLVELIAVIALIALLAIIAVPSYLGISKKIKQNMFESKLKTVEVAVELWADDHKTNCSSSLAELTVEDLINQNYLKADDKDGVFSDAEGNDIKSQKITLLDLDIANVCRDEVEYINTAPIIALGSSATALGFTNIDTLGQETSDIYIETTSNTDERCMELPDVIAVNGVEKTVKEDSWSLSSSIPFHITSDNQLCAYPVDTGTAILSVTTTDGDTVEEKLTNYHRSVEYKDGFINYWYIDRILEMEFAALNMRMGYEFSDVTVKNSSTSTYVNVEKSGSWGGTITYDDKIHLQILLSEDVDVNANYEICVWADIDYKGCQTIKLSDHFTED